MRGNTKLEMRGIEKLFPGVKALSNVNFSVEKGCVHGLCGENGAGKSTLMKILNGVYQPDKGKIFIDGKEVKINSPIDARKNKIAMIFQELNYIPELTIEEYMFLGREPIRKSGRIDWEKIRERTRELLQQEELSYDPETKLKELTVSDIQMLEIVKALSYQSEIIIMDEPTSAITSREAEFLFQKILDLKEKGVSVIYISHKLDEIFRIADKITVLRDGSVIDTKPLNELDIDKVIALMVGREITNVYPKERVEIGEVIFEVTDFSSRRNFKDININARTGEIVGIAGLMGAGRTEVFRSIFGLDPYVSGEIKVKNQAVKIRNVHEAIDSGIAMLSEDRRRYGIIPMRSVTENVSLPNLERFIYNGYLHSKKETETVSEYCRRINVRTPSLETTVDSLSGGNQQKVLLARWMLRELDILILDEPTRGIDVGAKYEIYKLMTELAKEKKAIIMVSSELPELIGMCDRIYVMASGRITGELQDNEFTQENIMRLATKG